MREPGDFDALDVAREQLRSAMVFNPEGHMSFENRLQLGLLAAQVALAERLPLRINGTTKVLRDDDEEEFEWDAELIERVLRKLGPAGRRWIRALVAEGGSATPARLKEITGAKALGGMMTTMRRAAHGISRRFPPPQLIAVHRSDDPQNPVILGYHLPDGTVPLIVTALERIDNNP